MDFGKPGTFVPGRGERGTWNRPRGSKRFVLLDLYGYETRSTGYISDTHNSHHDMLPAIKETNGTRCLYCLLEKYWYWYQHTFLITFLCLTVSAWDVSTGLPVFFGLSAPPSASSGVIPHP